METDNVHDDIRMNIDNYFDAEGFEEPMFISRVDSVKIRVGELEKKCDRAILEDVRN